MSTDYPQRLNLSSPNSPSRHKFRNLNILTAGIGSWAHQDESMIAEVKVGLVLSFQDNAASEQLIRSDDTPMGTVVPVQTTIILDMKAAMEELNELCEDMPEHVSNMVQGIYLYNNMAPLERFQKTGCEIEAGDATPVLKEPDIQTTSHAATQGTLAIGTTQSEPVDRKSSVSRYGRGTRKAASM